MLQTINKPTYTHRPNFTSTERLIKRGRYEIRYIPTNLVPEEVKVTLSTSNIVFDFMYPSEEAIDSKFVNRDVRVDVGVHTGKVLRLSADFAEGDYNALIVRLGDIMQAVNTLRSNAAREAIKKSYEVVVMRLIAFMKDKIVEDRVGLSAVLQSKAVTAA